MPRCRKEATQNARNRRRRFLVRLEKTNQAIEVQITQECANGQARFLMYEVPMWKETLEFDMHAGPGPTPVKALVAGKVFHQKTGGFVGVSNVGLDENWLGNHMSQANLYGYGRLAWNPYLSVKQITDEWTNQTFSANPKVVDTIGARCKCQSRGTRTRITPGRWACRH